MTICTFSIYIPPIGIASSIVILYEIIAAKVHVWSKNVIQRIKRASSSTVDLVGLFKAVGETLACVT